MRRILTLLICLSFLAACTPAGTQVSPVDAPETFIGREWRLEQIGSSPAVEFSRMTVTFSPDGQVYGRGGCNRFSGRWKMENGRLAVGPLMSTLMMCHPEALADQETRFFKGLGDAERVSVDAGAGKLRIQGAGPEGDMVFDEVRFDAVARGTVFYRERMALSPDATVVVQLQDVSRADAPAVTIGEQTLRNPGQVPIAFAVPYDSDELVQGHTYAVRAEIREQGRLLFTTDTRHLLTDAPMEIMLVRVR